MVLLLRSLLSRPRLLRRHAFGRRTQRSVDSTRIESSTEVVKGFRAPHRGEMRRSGAHELGSPGARLAPLPVGTSSHSLSRRKYRPSEDAPQTGEVAPASILVSE